MTTATPSREAGDALQDEEIARKLASEMPLVKAHYEHPVTRTGGEQVRYAHAHIRTDVYEAIFNQYCPRIPLASLPTERRQGISTEVLTAFLEDFAQPRPMTPDERQEFLEAIFAASGW